MRPLIRFGVAALAATAISGCASFQHRSQMTDFNTAYASGDYTTALQSMAFDIDSEKEVDTEAHLLEILHQAELYRLNGNFSKSAEYYDLAEQGMKYLDTENLAEESGETFMAVMINDSARDYEALMSEAVLVNTYKALAFLAEGNNEYARIEFNRADDRTRRAVDFFADEIAEQQEKLAEEAREAAEAEAASANAEDGESPQDSAANSALFARQSLQSEGLQQAVAGNYGEPSQWAVYSEFIVPASTYLNGLYFLANGAVSSDYDKAVDSLKRVAQMNEDSPQLLNDLALAEDLAAGRQRPEELKPQVWVVYENGLGPVLEEMRFDVPLLLFHGNQQAPAYTGIALPRYASRSAIPGHLIAITGEGTTAETEVLSDMGTVFQTEMKARFTGVLTRAVASAVVKAVIQNEASERFGLAGQLGSALLTAATTQADLRGWQALPDHWQVTRISRPQDGELTLAQDDGTTLGSVTIPDQPFTLVYVKRPSLQAPATVMTLDLQGASPGSMARLPAVPEKAEVSSASNPESGGNNQ
ncbi:COG3014 family protein [Marinobacter lacisalsi]|uniref:COG3014 family protein n=1 Tax=Marinobacter lacisalsi TaxID=475979 RepID=A0ABV8QFK9_9GAMM